MVNYILINVDLAIKNENKFMSPPSDQHEHSEYVQRLVDCLEEAHALLREQQMTVRQDDGEEPPCFRLVT